MTTTAVGPGAEPSSLEAMRRLLLVFPIAQTVFLLLFVSTFAALVGLHGDPGAAYRIATVLLGALLLADLLSELWRRRPRPAWPREVVAAALVVTATLGNEIAGFWGDATASTALWTFLSVLSLRDRVVRTLLVTLALALAYVGLGFAVAPDHNATHRFSTLLGTVLAATVAALIVRALLAAAASVDRAASEARAAREHRQGEKAEEVALATYLDLLHGTVVPALTLLRDVGGQPPSPPLADLALTAARDAEQRLRDRPGEGSRECAALFQRMQIGWIDPEVLDEPTDACLHPEPDGVVADTLVEAVAEALRNAVRHAPGAEVHLSRRCTPEEVTFTVLDDGPGFDPAIASGLGTRQTLGRSLRLAGSTSTIDTGPTGTRVVVGHGFAAPGPASRFELTYAAVPVAAATAGAWWSATVVALGLGGGLEAFLGHSPWWVWAVNLLWALGVLAVASRRPVPMVPAVLVGVAYAGLLHVSLLATPDSQRQGGGSWFVGLVSLSLMTYALTARPRDLLLVLAPLALVVDGWVLAGPLPPAHTGLGVASMFAVLWPLIGLPIGRTLRHLGRRLAEQQALARRWQRERQWRLAGGLRASRLAAGLEHDVVPLLRAVVAAGGTVDEATAAACDRLARTTLLELHWRGQLSPALARSIMRHRAAGGVVRLGAGHQGAAPPRRGMALLHAAIGFVGPGDELDWRPGDGGGDLRLRTSAVAAASTRIARGAGPEAEVQVSEQVLRVSYSEPNLPRLVDCPTPDPAPKKSG